MRDIPNNQTNQKPTYKDFQSFLQTYGNGSVNSRSISPTSSSSSLQSTESEVNAPKTYNEFLQSYGTKKFGSVRMKNHNSGADERDTTTNTNNNNKKLLRSELIINIKAPEDLKNGHHQESYLKVTPATSPKVVVSKHIDNSTIPDEMIYAKTAVLEELLTKSPTLKKQPSSHIKTNNPKSIYHKLEQFTNPKKDMITPPPLPNSKPPIFRRNSSSGSLKSPISPKPPVPQKTFLKSDDKRNNSYKEDVKEDQLMRELQNMMNQDVANNKMIKILPPPKFIQQLSQGTHSYQNNIPNTTTVVPVSDANADVDKKDPTVKKLVYNTYRGMLGAYNNKANNMVSTLPRNFVVQDRGVRKQVESITSQGCLANLNGRINPNPED